MMNRRGFLGASLTVLSAPWMAAGAVVCRKPHVQRVRRTGATICWASDAPGAATVRIAGPEGGTRTVPAVTVRFAAGERGASADFYRHWARVEELEPATEYSYSIHLDGRDVTPAGETRFRTAGQNDFTFLAIGDSGTGSDDQKRLAATFQRDPAALVIHTGDLVYPTGTFEAYDRNHFDVYQEAMRRIPFFPVPGNHDYYDFGAEPYRALHDLPRMNVAEKDQGRYYSFEWGDVHFVCLDSNAPLEEAAAGRGEMLRWLEADLAACTKFWRVAVFHHPPYAAGPNWEDAYTAMARAHIVPVLERFGVPLIVSGHEHSYQRSVPIRGGAEAAGGAIYLTTGGGGAALYPVFDSPLVAKGASVFHYLRASVAGRRMRFAAIDTEGTAFDSFVVEPGPVVRGAVNAASGSGAIGRGGVVSVYGWQFTPETIANGGGDVRVLAGGVEARVLAAGPMQLNFVLPGELAGAQTVEVITPGGSARASIEIRAAAPALFGDSVFENGRAQVTAEAPCRAGSRVAVFLTGLSRWTGPVNLRVGGVSAGSQLEEAMPGVQRLWFTVPAGLKAGSYGLEVEADGVHSNVVALFVG